MNVKKNDFVELEFTGKANGELFDTTDKKEAEKMGLTADVKPIVVSVGNGMVLDGLDKDLEGKEIGKKYSIHISVDNAFGRRDPSLIKTIPMRIFKEKNMNPMPGMSLQMDNQMAKVISVSGGRVMVDFNNPLAGKEIDYDFKILKKVDDNSEKINALQDFFFRQRFEFSINEKKVIFKDEKIKPLIDMLKDKLKEMIDMDFEVEEKKVENKEDKKNGNASNKSESSKDTKIEDTNKNKTDKQISEDKSRNKTKNDFNIDSIKRR